MRTLVSALFVAAAAASADEAATDSANATTAGNETHVLEAVQEETKEETPVAEEEIPVSKEANEETPVAEEETPVATEKTKESNPADTTDPVAKTKNTESPSSFKSTALKYTAIAVVICGIAAGAFAYFRKSEESETTETA